MTEGAVGLVTPALSSGVPGRTLMFFMRNVTHEILRPLGRHRGLSAMDVFVGSTVHVDRSPIKVSTARLLLFSLTRLTLLSSVD